jgi:hypothetical protein
MLFKIRVGVLIKILKGTQLRFYSAMAVPQLLYGRERGT